MANRWRRGNKAKKRLARRVKDYEENVLGAKGHEMKVDQRIRTGGYRRPGSLKR